MKIGYISLDFFLGSEDPIYNAHELCIYLPTIYFANWYNLLDKGSFRSVGFVSW